MPGGGNNLFVFATDKTEQAAALEFVKFLTSPDGLTIWTKGTGILLRQHLRSFPKALVEAARLDGANNWQVL